MNSCETCQAKLLHLVYGLLDDGEQKEALAHIATCADCRAALARAEEQQKLMALAARTEFPGVRFTPPQEAARAMPRRGRPRPWVRWAVAASILFVLFIGGTALGIYGWQARTSQFLRAKEKYAGAQAAFRQQNQQTQADVERRNNEIQVMQEKLRGLTGDWDREASEAEQTLREKKVQVVIKGPRSLQAGARNAYQIEMRPRNNVPLKKGSMIVQLVNPATKDVLFKKEIANPGSVQVDLPANLPLKPGIHLALEVKAQLEDGGPVQVSEQLPVLDPLFLAHLTTDRPMYRPGEVVHFRSLTLERFSLKPVQEDFHIIFRITGPNGAEVYKVEGASHVVSNDKETIKGPDGKPVRGLAAGQFQLPPQIPGGEYTLHVSEGANRFPSEKRKFLVNRYQAPRLNKEIEFTRKSYGPGEMVEARCQVARVEGGAAIAEQPVYAFLQVDGRPQDTWLKTDVAGKVLVKFKLPDAIDKGEASLSVRFTDGGNTETIVRPVPVIVKKLLVQFYPEGGDLVADVPNRVYFQVRTPTGKPAELHGRIVDRSRNEVAAAQTLNDDKEAGVNQGMGSFVLTPKAGQRYELEIDSPIGIAGRHFLPDVKKDGVVLTIAQGVVKDKIDMVLASAGKDRRLMAGAYCRGRLIDNTSVLDVKQGQAKKITLRTAPGVSGVYRVTVFEVPGGADDDQLLPVAERLIYRRPVEHLQIDISADKQAYTPGEPVKISLQTTNEKKTQAPAILLVSVVDLSVLKLADEKTARGLPAHFYLTTEVKKPEDLEYADFLVSDHPKAVTALDLLLGTQGWRRFAEQSPREFLKKNQREAEDAQRLLAVNGLEDQQTDTSTQAAVARVNQKFAPKLVELETGLAGKQKEQAKVVAEARFQLQGAQSQVQMAQQATRGAAIQLVDYQQTFARVSLGVLVLALLIGGVGSVVLGLRRLASNYGRPLPFLASGLGLLLVLFLGSLAGTFFLMGHRGNERLAMLFNGNMDPVVAEVLAQKNAAGAGDAMAAVVVDMDAAGAPEDANRGMGLGGIGKMAPAPAMPPMGGAGGMPQADANLGLRLGEALDEKGQGLGRPGPGQDGIHMDMPPQEMFGLLEARKDGEMKEEPRLMGGGKQAGAMAGVMAPEGFAGRQKRMAGLQVAQRRLTLLRALRQPFAVREYAHQHQPSPDNVRRDFAETLYWHPVLVLADGSGTIDFQLSDAVSRFQVLAMGHTLDGRLGSGTLEIASRLPYGIEPKVPIEVTSTDRITLPVTIANDSSQAGSVQIELNAKGLKVLEGAGNQIMVGAGQRKRQLFRLEPSVVEGEATLNLLGRFTPSGIDRVERKFAIVPEGFPVIDSQSDLLEGVGRYDVVLPEHWVNGTLKLQAQVFPSTLADLQKGLEAMLREPCGCFEQSSSSNYPNVLILNYLKESEQSKPEVEKRARALLASGYQRLTSFECVDPQTQAIKQGYEWFGQTAPPHEALTAYGLLQFRDMAGLHPVDQAMVERTRKYLISQRDGKGGFKRNPRALDSFGGAPDEITNAYIVWALSEGGNDDVDIELTALVKQAKDSKDPYFLALVGNSLVNRNKTKESEDVLRKLAGLQQAGGQLQGTRTSITGSSGRDLEIETTALAVLAWLKANRPEFNPAVQKAVKWLGQQRGGYGGFGNTQSTILALKALIAHTRVNRKTANAGELKLYINDRPQSVDTLAFPAGSQEPLVVRLADETLLKPGKNKIKLEMSGGNAFPCTVTSSYRTLKPANPDNCPVHLTTRLDRIAADEGNTVRLKAIVENKSGKDQGMAVAILGLPGGVSLPEDFTQLKDLARLRDNDTKPGVISFFEVRGRELILYWRGLAKDQKIEVDLDLICRIPGEYRGPASRAYLYYNADQKYWVEPVGIAIQAKE